MSKKNIKRAKEAKDKRQESYTNYDAVVKAKEIATPIEEKSNKRRKALRENAATVISTLAISLTVILYAYNKGYARVFNIPASCIPLDLKRLVPVAIIVCGVLAYVFTYVALLRTDIALKNKRINLLRMFYGFIIVRYFLSASNIENYLGSVWSYIVPVLLSIVIELLVIYIRRPKRIKTISKEEYSVKVENQLYNGFLYSNFFKTGLWFLVVAVILAPTFGEISTRANTDYQTCVYKDELYAVIVDYEDRVLAQKATVENQKLSICTSEYTFIPKEGTAFINTKFNSVELVSELIDTGLEVDQTEHPTNSPSGNDNQNTNPLDSP